MSVAALRGDIGHPDQPGFGLGPMPRLAEGGHDRDEFVRLVPAIPRLSLAGQVCAAWCS
jgi:hypothetical protein